MGEKGERGERGDKGEKGEKGEPGILTDILRVMDHSFFAIHNNYIFQDKDCMKIDVKIDTTQRGIIFLAKILIKKYQRYVYQIPAERNIFSVEWAGKNSSDYEEIGNQQYFWDEKPFDRFLLLKIYCF